MSNYLRNNSLSGRLRQMIVLRTIKQWGAKYPWVVQVRNSLKEGLEQSIIDAIDKGQEPALTSQKDLAAFQLCKELVETRQVSDKTHQQAMELFGENGVADIVVMTGFFTMVSFTANAFDIRSADRVSLMPGWEQGRLAQLDRGRIPPLVLQLATRERVNVGNNGAENRLAPELTYWTAGSFPARLGDIVAHRGKPQRERLLVMVGGPGVDARS